MLLKNIDNLFSKLRMNLSQNWLLQMYEINIIDVSELNLMHNMSKLFNKKCLKEQLLSKYANIKKNKIC